MTRGPLGTKGRAEGLLCFTNVVHPRLRTERASPARAILTNTMQPNLFCLHIKSFAKGSESSDTDMYVVSRCLPGIMDFSVHGVSYKYAYQQ